MVTSRARLGHLVLAAAYRNAGLTAKTISTLDVLSGGRTELGIGAGWKEDEWLAYGYGFPRRRRAPGDPGRLPRDHHPHARARGAPPRQGEHAHVIDAIHEPKGLQQPRIPILIGGNGPKVTWRLAARFADELNLDALAPEDVERALPVIAQRCEEIGRDPSTLRVSIHMWGAAYAGPARPGARGCGNTWTSASTGRSSRPTRRSRTRRCSMRSRRLRSAGLLEERPGI